MTSRPIFLGPCTQVPSLLWLPRMDVFVAAKQALVKWSMMLKS